MLRISRDTALLTVLIAGLTAGPAITSSASAGAADDKESISLSRTIDPGSEAGKANSVFAREEGDYDLKSYKVSETLKLSGDRIGSPSVSARDMRLMRSGSYPSTVRQGGKKKMAISVLASALLPGLGELYLYVDRGDWSDWSTLARVPAFIGIDAYLWYGYKDNYDKGKDSKKEYEEFCDTHWSEARFLLQHPYCEGIGGCSDWHVYNDNADEMADFYFIYIPKNLDREEYYENCGKYDAFAFGWDDWDGDSWDGTYENFQPWTPNRLAYWDMRAVSDEFLVSADRHLMMLIVNRVVSMIDALWLAHRMNNDSLDDGGWSIDLSPDAVTPTVGISYRF
ncbi:MAG: hypothetical protein JW814_08330 [Candidatus Krumholzibacteriota bacterium]|nr:hypothetical protein [Candidatus Krumholzibacteriota bacterium]